MQLKLIFSNSPIFQSTTKKRADEMSEKYWPIVFDFLTAKIYVFKKYLHIIQKETNLVSKAQKLIIYIYSRLEITADIISSEL